MENDKNLEMRYRIVSELTSDYAYAFRVETNGSIASEWVAGALTQVTGFTEAEIFDMGGWETLIHPEDLKIAYDQLHDLVAGQPCTVEYRIETKSGQIRWIRDTARPELNESTGSIQRICGACQDVTERKGVEQALIRSEERYRSLVEDINDIAYSATAEGQLTYLAPQFARYGISVEDVIRDGVFSVILPEDQETALGDFELTMTTGQEFSTEFRIRGGDGKIYWLEDHGRVIQDSEGQTIGLSGVLRDVTARKQAEEALDKSEERFRRIAEQSIDAIFQIDREGRITYLSPAISRITGWHPEELAGRSLTLTLLDDQRRPCTQVVERLLCGDVVEAFKGRLSAKDGDDAIVEVNASPLWEGDEIVGAVGIIRDISARCTLEAQLFQMQKMEAIGTLAGGVAHDFNNQLVGIMGYSDMLKISSRPGDRVYQAADVIQRAAERAAELTGQLLGFARKGKLQSHPVDIHTIVKEVLTLLSRTIDRRISMTTGLTDGELCLMGDPGQLEQVLLNLAVNACDAMPGGGELVIETALIELDAAACSRFAGLSPGSHVRLSIRDTGHGMNEETRERIFEPFFTTKRSGTGMGLAMVYGIVKNHGGVIHVESEPDRGTTMTLVFPACDEIPKAEEERESRPPLQASGRILLADDEETARITLCAMLESAGYQVTCAVDGQDALDRFREAQGELDLVILDLSMPKLDGGDCFRRIKTLDPAVRAILTTGHALDGSVQRLLDEGMVGFLKKPFVMADLIDVISTATCR
jgi:PAS domain S-box-containing protein